MYKEYDVKKKNGAGVMATVKNEFFTGLFLENLFSGEWTNS